MHDEIKKFALDGIIADSSNLVKAKENLVKNLEDQMRDFGYVPALDLEPQFTLQFAPEYERYDFVLSIYGIYVGKDKSWDTAGIMTGKPIMRYTPTLK